MAKQYQYVGTCTKCGSQNMLVSFIEYATAKTVKCGCCKTQHQVDPDGEFRGIKSTYKDTHVE